MIDLRASREDSGNAVSLQVDLPRRCKRCSRLQAGALSRAGDGSGERRAKLLMRGRHG